MWPEACCFWQSVLSECTLYGAYFKVGRDAFARMNLTWEVNLIKYICNEYELFAVRKSARDTGNARRYTATVCYFDAKMFIH